MIQTDFNNLDGTIPSELGPLTPIPIIYSDDDREDAYVTLPSNLRLLSLGKLIGDENTIKSVINIYQQRKSSVSACFWITTEQ